MSLHVDGPSWAHCDRCGYYHNESIDCTYDPFDDMWECVGCEALISRGDWCEDCAGMESFAHYLQETGRAYQ